VGREPLDRAKNDSLNKLTVYAYEHEGDGPVSREQICQEVRRLADVAIESSNEQSSRKKFRVAMLELAAYAIFAAAESDK
jgi:hypothetical protein